MANQWLRLYSEFATDPKIQMMGEALQRRYIMLLCLRCSNDDVTLHDDEITFQLRISNEEWKETKSAFLAKNLIGSDNSPSAWDKRQYRSDSSTERVSRFRNKAKQECNVSVTPPDTDTDTDTEQKEQKTSRAPRFDAQAHLVSIGVDASIAADWITHRKAKKAAITNTVIAGITREAIKAGRPLADVLEACCQRGWIGFKAEWLQNGQNDQRVTAFSTRRDIERDEVSAVLCGRQPALQPRLITGEVVS